MNPYTFGLIITVAVPLSFCALVIWARMVYYLVYCLVYLATGVSGHWCIRPLVYLVYYLVYRLVYYLMNYFQHAVQQAVFAWWDAFAR